jgi:NAD(P)-dependent dehydrogenase (short-subunit alcohol dehydrogenase family)
LGVAEEITGLAGPQGIDALVCNAGALLNERTLTQEGTETTFACHLLYGSYGLVTMMEPCLRAAAQTGREPRVVLMSSGGMYNTAFPKWHIAASMPEQVAGMIAGELPKYDGQMAYAYAKRGQVLLAEHWAQAEAADQAARQGAGGDGGVLGRAAAAWGADGQGGEGKAGGGEAKAEGGGGEGGGRQGSRLSAPTQAGPRPLALTQPTGVHKSS